MQKYSSRVTITGLIVSLILAGFGAFICHRLWSINGNSLTTAFQLRIESVVNMTFTILSQRYIYIILGFTVLQEATMIFSRYVLGKQGKKERLHIKHKGKRHGMHLLHWGIAICAIGVIGQMTNTSMNILLICIGVSCILSDFLHHFVLKQLHGDHEGDGNLINPFC